MGSKHEFFDCDISCNTHHKRKNSPYELLKFDGKKSR